MKTLPLRIFSATAAILLLTSIYYFFSSSGVMALGFILCFIGAIECERLIFSQFSILKAVRYWFLGTCLLLMLLTLMNITGLIAVWGITLALYFVGALWLLRGRIENDKLLICLALSSLGLIYCGLFPMFALGVLQLENGIIWFLFLIGHVFTGDIFAYFGGILFGKNKLMPNLSPSKTVAGSVSGIIGSIIAGCVIGYFGLKTVPTFYLIGISFVGAVLAQTGDLFESLLKRVALVKDSGRIMPGHGGVLDRLDGVYFAAPLVYGAALFFTN